MNASDLRGFYEEGRPLVEQWLDLAEQFKALRDAARQKEVDWAQVKSLLRAQIEDAREGTDKRVRKILPPSTIVGPPEIGSAPAQSDVRHEMPDIPDNMRRVSA